MRSDAILRFPDKSGIWLKAALGSSPKDFNRTRGSLFADLRDANAFRKRVLRPGKNRVGGQSDRPFRRRNLFDRGQ